MAPRTFANEDEWDAYHQLNPFIRHTIKQISPEVWSIGASSMCYKTTADDPPAGAFASWKDGSHCYHLTPRTSSSPPVPADNDSVPERIYDGGYAGSVWAIGDEAIIKVKSWLPGQQSEASTIEFIRQHFPTIPLPEVICYWEDQPANRSFQVMRRIKGQNLAEAWPDMSAQQRQRIVEEVASHADTLSKLTRPRYESVDGRGMLDRWHMAPDRDKPYWRLDYLGPFSIPEMRAHMASISTAPPPPLPDMFVLFHPDLNPLNIMVEIDEEHARLLAIIDWGEAGFYPPYWVATKCMAHWLENKRLSQEETGAYASSLRHALAERGHADAYHEWFHAWDDGKFETEE